MGYLLGKIKAVLMGDFGGADTKVAVDTDGHLQVDILTLNVGDHASRHITPGEDLLQDAQADDATKGIATFEADDFDDSSGKIDLADSVAKSLPTDSGTATPSAHVVTFTGGAGIGTSGAAAAITIAFDITDTDITKDEDNLGSDSDVHLATQQSIKAYIDAGGASSSIQDLDGDTKVQTDEGTVDEDKIRFDVGPTGEVGLLSETFTESYLKFNKHSDADGDTFIQVEESADEDIIRVDIEGSEVAIWDATSLTLPLQPCFNAYATGDSGNMSINTRYTAVYDGERIDQGSDFNLGTYTFTAPVDGVYLLSFSLYFSTTLDASAQFYEARLITSNRIYYFMLAPHWASDCNYHSLGGTVLADMDANDTAYVDGYQQGGAPQCSIYGAALTHQTTFFHGYKIA